MFLKKQLNKKNIIIYLITLLFAICGIILLNKAFWQDLMEQAFGPSMSYDTVVKLGNTKNAVWNTMLKESLSIEAWESVFKKSCFINKQIQNGVTESKCTEMWWDRKIEIIDVNVKAPLIVRITKFLLRMTIILSITMVIFNSVKYMIEVLWWKDRNSAESKKNLIFVAAWVIVALMSVSIINLVISVPKSSLKTSDDLASFAIWCKTWSTIIVGNDLKKWICENSDFWHPDYTIDYRYWEKNRAWKRCRFPEDWIFNTNWILIDWKNPEKNGDGEWKAITNSEMETKCVEDIWWTVVK